ncbi:MAG: hypothetical protein ACKOAP_07740, partial [Vulcanococcus sp.]
MVLGTSSGAGKSLMTAALCRVLRSRGETPLPFKGQNMSNNAWVDQAGGEMAYSQALQAWAAGLEPQCAMNPVLLKPQGDSTSEVIHLGRSSRSRESSGGNSSSSQGITPSTGTPVWASSQRRPSSKSSRRPRKRLINSPRISGR